MRLEFTRITLRDFKEYRGKHALVLSSLGNGLHYVQGRNRVDALGSNGSGKSTLWDAFMWALTGRTVRGLRGTDVRTWGSKRQAMSRVDFYCNDQPHWVKRSTEKNGLWLDGKLASQEAIDRLLGLSIVNLPHTIILGQKQELFFDLKPSQKLEILSETLQLDKWDERSARAKTRTKDLEAVQTSVEGHIRVLTDIKEAAWGTIEELKEKSRTWERERAEADTKREEQGDKVRATLERVQGEVGTHDLAYDSAETELRAARNDLTKHSASRDDIVSALEKAKRLARIAKEEYDDLKAIADSGVCPTCEQPIAKHKAVAHDAKMSLKNAKHRMQVKSDHVIVRETQLELVDKALKATREAIKTFAKKSDDAKDKLDQGNASIAELKQQLAVLKASSRSEEVNPYAEALSNARKQVKDAKAGIEEHKEKIAKLSRKIIRTRYWIDGFKQLRLYLLQETLEELQEVTQNLLPSVGLSGWTVQYDIERETKKGDVSTGLNVRILKPGMEKAVRWEAWSGGEGQRLLIVGAMALSEVLLRRAGIECDLMVLDEPTRHMSKEGIAELVDHLVERARDMQLFYCDHQVVESNRFASVITISKDEHGSQIKTTQT